MCCCLSVFLQRTRVRSNLQPRRRLQLQNFKSKVNASNQTGEIVAWIGSLIRDNAVLQMDERFLFRQSLRKM